MRFVLEDLERQHTVSRTFLCITAGQKTLTQDGIFGTFLDQ